MPQTLELAWPGTEFIKDLFFLFLLGRQSCHQQLRLTADTTIKQMIIREQLASIEDIYLIVNKWIEFCLTPTQLRLWQINPVRCKILLQQYSGTLQVFSKFTNNNYGINFPEIELVFTGSKFPDKGFLLVTGDIILAHHSVDDYDGIEGRLMTDHYLLAVNGLNKSIEFLTHFSASQCKLLYSGLLEQLAITCPNLQQLNLVN